MKSTPNLPTDIAWAAGLFEGEGSIHIRERTSGIGPSYYVRLSMGMTDEDVVDRFHQIVGCGNVWVRLNPAPPSVKTQYRWSAGKREDVLLVLEAFKPWLGQRRRDRADEAILKLENHPPKKRGPQTQQTTPPTHRE